MTITVDIAPDIQAELTRRAIAQGSPLEVYAANLLAASVEGPPNRSALTESRIDITISEMAQFSHSIPALPESAFTRESIYKDHD
jgi:hypothetical protein